MTSPEETTYSPNTQTTNIPPPPYHLSYTYATQPTSFGTYSNNQGIPTPIIRLGEFQPRQIDQVTPPTRYRPSLGCFDLCCFLTVFLAVLIITLIIEYSVKNNKADWNLLHSTAFPSKAPSLHFSQQLPIQQQSPTTYHTSCVTWSRSGETQYSNGENSYPEKSK